MSPRSTVHRTWRSWPKRTWKVDRRGGGGSEKQVVGSHCRVRYFGPVSVVTKILWGEVELLCTWERTTINWHSLFIPPFPASNTCYFCCTDTRGSVTLRWHLIMYGARQLGAPLPWQNRLDWCQASALPTALLLPLQGLGDCFQRP